MGSIATGTRRENTIARPPLTVWRTCTAFRRRWISLGRITAGSRPRKSRRSPAASTTSKPCIIPAPSWSSLRIYLKNATRRLPANVTVHENTPIVAVQFGAPKHICETPAGTIRASKVIICASGLSYEVWLLREPRHTAVHICEHDTTADGERACRGWEIRKPTDLFRPTASARRFVARSTTGFSFSNVYSYATDFKTTTQDVMRARVQQQIAFDRRWPELSPYRLRGQLGRPSYPRAKWRHGLWRIGGERLRRRLLQWYRRRARSSLRQGRRRSGVRAIIAGDRHPEDARKSQQALSQALSQRWAFAS